MVKALVVDDSRAIRMILSRILRELGFEVHEAGNGREGLQVLETQKPGMELILTDWNMPEMNGLEFVKQVRHRPEFSSVPIVMVTTETEVEQMGAALEAGATEYVMKPFNKEILVEKLHMIGVTA